jgi:hypothetical protein
VSIGTAFNRAGKEENDRTRGEDVLKRDRVRVRNIDNCLADRCGGAQIANDREQEKEGSVGSRV